MTVQSKRTIRIVVLACLAGFALAFCGVGVLLIPVAVQQAREAQRRQQTIDNLKQIGEALHNYHSVQEALGEEDDRQPPADASSPHFSP